MSINSTKYIWFSSVVAKCTYSILLLLFTPIVCAQDIEEVTVTAEHSTVESLNDLASTAALDAEKLADAGIGNVEDVAAYVPNLVLTETDTGTNIVIRGIGAGVNQGFDQSVGLFIDGVPLPRSQMARAPFLDLENVQVLRGPQYALDGHYSIAGSVHMISSQATEEFTGNIDFNYTPSQEDKTLMMAVSLPLAESFGIRVALQSRKSNGYIENITRNEYGPQKDELILRTIFGFQFTDDFSGKLKIERGQFDTRGRQIEIIQNDPVPIPDRAPVIGLQGRNLTPSEATDFDRISRPVLVNYDAGALLLDQNQHAVSPVPFAYAGASYLEFLNNLYTAPTDINHIGNRIAPAGLLDDTLNYKRGADADEFSNNNSVNFTLNLEWWLGEHIVKLTTSYIEYEYDERIDADFTAAPLFVTNQGEEFDQSFARLDYASPEGTFIEFKAGLAYSETNLSYEDDTEINVDIDSEIDTNIFNSNFNVPPVFGLQDNPIIFDGRYPLEAFFARNRLALSSVAALRLLRPFRNFEQDAQTQSAYFQSTLNFSDTFRTILGFRYTHSEKEAVREVILGSRDGSIFPSTDVISALQFASFTFGSSFGIQPHTDKYIGIGGITESDIISVGWIPAPLTGSRREEAFLPSLAIQWDLHEDFSVLLSFKKANKLGGFDARSNTSPSVTDGRGMIPGTFEFEDEDATSYELGFKWFLPNGYGEINATAFYTDYKNLQLSRFDGKIGFNVDNAGAARNKGVEVEGLIQINDRWDAQYSLAWIDFEFTDYAAGPCYFGSTPEIYITPPVISPGILQSSGFKANQVVPIDYNESTATIVDDFENLAGLATFCDFSGKTNQYVAEWQGTFTINYSNDIISLGLFETTLDILYNSGYETTSTLDPDVAQEEYTQLNGRIGITSFEGTWEAALTLQNITNRKIVSYANELPLAVRTMGSKGFYGFVQSPRAIGLNLRYNFF